MGKQSTILIADSGSTKAEWCLIGSGRKKTFLTQGLSPYFLTGPQISETVTEGVARKMKGVEVDEVFFYGTGCASPKNAQAVKAAIRKVFPGAAVTVHHDLMAAARSVCGHGKGVASILGTGSNSCYYNGKKIVSNSPGLGYVLGDEGSGAYLGKKVVQYYLYNTFDEELKARFEDKYRTTAAEILEHVYKKPLPNRYLATYTLFLAENRGHFMVENILEDGLNDFFFYHLCKYPQIWTLPVSFVGSVAYGFKDVIQHLCDAYEFELGRIVKNPMQGLIDYHQSKN